MYEIHSCNVQDSQDQALALEFCLYEVLPMYKSYKSRKYLQLFFAAFFDKFLIEFTYLVVVINEKLNLLKMVVTWDIPLLLFVSVVNE